MIGEFLDSPIRPEVKIPSISRRVAANLRRIFHRHQLRRTLSERQFLHVLDCHNGAGVPVSMEWENKPIIVVDERRLNFVFHVGRRAADLRPDIANPHRLAVLIFTLVSDLDRKSTRLNSSHTVISYAVFCLKKKRTQPTKATIFPRPVMRTTDRTLLIRR